MTRRWPLIAALLASGPLLACGSDGGGQPIGGSGLAEQVVTIREAAEHGDANTARVALAALEDEVKAARESGALDEARAGTILAAAKNVKEDLGLLDGRPVTTTTRRTTTTVPTTAPLDTRGDEEHDDDDGNRGKGNGKGKRDDGDD